MEEKPEKPQEKSDTKPEENLPKVEEVKKRFVSINDLTSKEFKITQIFSKSKKKLEETKPGLFLHPKNINPYSNMRVLFH